MNAVKKEDAFMTSDEMLDRSSSWTLACDNALLNRLKKFSEDITRNSQDIVQECDILGKSIKQLDYRLINVSNEFLMLANTQFVENRVEEFEEFSSQASPSSTYATKSKSEREAELFSKMKQAIQLGLTTCSERRHLNASSTNRFKMKEPHLIGSPKFFSSKYVGLVDETRRRVPSYQDYNEMDSVSIGPRSDIYVPPMAAQAVKPGVQFTMPPTPVFPPRVSDQNIRFPGSEAIHNISRGPAVPPSPTISERSSVFGAGSASTVSKDNEPTIPASVTDELNKIYGSFAPPPLDDESDDDFRPSAGVGRIFEDDDDDDLFSEKELFPGAKKKPDFFARANPTAQLPSPVFSVPPPINPESQSQRQQLFRDEDDVETLVGPMPKTNDTPNMSTPTDPLPKNDGNAQPPEAIAPIRPKLPAGAVSMFGSLPPPVFNNGTLQTAQTASTPVPHSTAASNTQIRAHSAKEVASGLSPLYKDNTGSSGNQGSSGAQQSQIASQVQEKSISHGVPSSSESVKSKPSRAVPVSSLFDDSSDEDIFKGSKKQETLRPPTITQSGVNTRGVTPPKLVVPKVVPSVSPQVKKTVKKSIFDESESEDDLFSSRPIVARSEGKKSTAAEEEDLFRPEPKKTLISKKIAKGSSLFGDDSDSDSDLFGNKRKSAAKPKTVVTEQEKPLLESKKPLFEAKTPEIQVPTPGPSTSRGPSAKMADVQAWNDDDDLFAVPPQMKVREDSPAKTILNNNNNEEEPEETTKSEESVIKSSSNDSVTSNPIIEPDTKRATQKAPIKKSIFDDSESDDDLFSGKKPIADSDTTDSVAPVKPQLSTNTEKRSSLFDESDSDSDLFSGSKKIGFQNSSALKDSVTNDDVTPEPDSSPIVIENTLQRKESGNSLSSSEEKDDSKKENIQDEPKPTKNIGNKISEKIKAMQNSNKDISKTDDETDSSAVKVKKDIKSKISVKSLALNLNINPLALKVGARPPKLGSSTPNTPDQDTNPVAVRTAPSTPEKTDVEEARPIISKSKSEAVVGENVERKTVQSSAKPAKVEDLVGILKARVKIQNKRRPPSRQFLKSLAVPKKEDEVDEETKDNQKEPETTNEAPESETLEKDDTDSVLNEDIEKSSIPDEENIEKEDSVTESE